ncbi:GIN domain-containing protein [Elizabethkingia meningoseptica]|uniref:GIN domain-containing protein n=1 Tax=Elizabethkingia meningoseptica TaxID=238 RepID=UPI00389121B5
MKKFLFLILTLNILTRCISNDNTIISQVKNIGEYNKIENNSIANVIISDKVPVNKIIMNGNKKQLRTLKFQIINKNLIFTSESSLKNISIPTTIYLNNNSLHKIRTNGIGTINSKIDQVNKNLDIEVSNISKVFLKINNENISLNINSSGKVYLKGTTNMFRVNVDKTGKLFADSLTCHTVNISVQKSGLAKVNASNILNASVTDIGKISYKKHKNLTLIKSEDKLGKIIFYD